MSLEQVGTGQQRLPVRFVGSGSEYFRIWVVNLLLTLVTVGIYYPYAKVRRLKYFHGATEVAGNPLSFHANPHAMLRGYLLVALMLGAYTLAGRFSPAAGLVAFVILAALWPALWHSSLRFRLANTGWHGLRLRFTGERRGAYAALAPGFALAFLLLAGGLWLQPEGVAGSNPDAQPQPPDATAVMVVGLALPLLMLLASPALLWLLRSYQHRHYALASQSTRFDVTAGAFYKLGLRMAGVGFLAMLLVGVVVGLVMAWWRPWAAIDGSGTDKGWVMAMGVFIGLATTFMVYLVVWPWLTARTQNLVWNGTRTHALRFDSRLRFAPLLRLTLKNWLLIVLTLGLYFPFAAVATARMRLQAVEVLTTADPDALAASDTPHDEAAAGDAAGDLLGLDIGL